MRFFVTGGAGFLGINIIRYILNKGHDVVSYDINPFDYPERDRITEVMGDVRDYELVEKSMQGCDIVVHTAAALPLYTPEDIHTTDVDGARNVLEAAQKHIVDRVVFISSTAVYGVPDHHPLVETDKMIGVGPYGEAKVEAEGVVEEYRAKELCLPTLRPKSYVGPERLGVFALLYDWAHDGKNFPIIGNGNNLYQYLDVEDLCDAIWLCVVGDKEIVNDIFNIGAKEFGTVKEDFQAVLDHAGHRKKVKCFPEGFAIGLLKLLEKMRLSPLYKWIYETVGKESFVSIEKAEKILGYKPKYSNKAALIRNYDWYVENIDNFGTESGLTHRVPWSQGILRFFKVFF
ncbi:MAG TPA: NAD(P)-dependent oxidoreductase [bacterium]